MIKVYKDLTMQNEEDMLAYVTNGKSLTGETITIDDYDEVKYKEVLLRDGQSEKKADKEIEKIKKQKKDKKDRETKEKDK